ncbi:MAG: His-Xaa-Ser system radical SAM maturase HxsC [Patescibacteria group bacterium]|nr:His-Xaa-Ser system radical SAM maturase HxsC [Patescibacteria group bacterium]
MIVSGGSSYFPRGYAGYLFFEKPAGQVPQNSFLLEHGLSYLQAGDIIKIKPERNSVRVLYRKNSPHNALLLTERCDNFCLMCSQPPKDIDDSYLAEEVLRTIPLMSPETKEITLTGGEPTLLGESLIQIIQSLKRHLPATAVHILSNGRSFKQWEYAKAIADIGHNDLMIGIPLYSDVPWLHNHVVQAEHAFDDTIRGILNLKSVGVKVEIRIVVHRLTFARLPDLARFIRRNLTFCDHVALMGLEITGFTKINLDKLWIDPVDYQSQLREAVELLARARIPVSIYNHQLCLLDPSLYPFSRKSISDWKNEYLPECEGCMRKGECGGFFSSASLRHSAHIDPFQY